MRGIDRSATRPTQHLPKHTFRVQPELGLAAWDCGSLLKHAGTLEFGVERELGDRLGLFGVGELHLGGVGVGIIGRGAL